MRSISSVPGALLFRSVSVVILVLILVLVFLPYSKELSDKTAQIERVKVIQELDMALSFRLYQATIEGRLDELKTFHLQNPFRALDGENYKAPQTYNGEVTLPVIFKKSGWYFDNIARNIFYWGNNAVISDRYQLQFIYKDLNKSGQYEAAVDVIEKLGMVKIK